MEAAGDFCNKFEGDSRELLEVSHKQCRQQNFQGSGENKMQIRMFSQKVKQRANLLYVASCARRLKIFLTLASFWICGQNIDNMYPSDRNELQCDHHIHVVEDDFMLVQSKTIAAIVWQFCFCTGAERQIEQPTCPQSYHHDHDHHLHWPTYPQKHSRRPMVGSSASRFRLLRPATL